MKRLRILTNNKGAALITVIMVFAVLSILATVVISTAYIEARQVRNQKDLLRASFIAKSGAEITAFVIETNFADFVTNPRSPQSGIVLHDSTFDIELVIIKPPESSLDTIIIKSTGYSSESSSIVFLELTKAGERKWHRENPFP